MSVGGLKKSKTEESFPSYHFIALTYFVHTLMTSGQSLMCQLHNVEAFLFELPKSRRFNEDIDRPAKLKTKAETPYLSALDFCNPPI